MLARQMETKFILINNFEYVNKPGNWLAYKLRKEKKIWKLQEDELFKERADIQKVIFNYYPIWYKRQAMSLGKMYEYLKKQKLPQITEQQKYI